MAVPYAVVQLLAATILLGAQSEDIYQRMRQTLGDAAVAELRARNFSKLEERLASTPPGNDINRAEILALKAAVEFLDGKMSQAAVDFRESDKIRPAKESDRFTYAM